MGVADQSKATYMELQRKKVHRYVIFKIDEKKNEVVVEKTGCPAESYDDFTAALPENDCRYAVYDYDFVTPDNCQKSKIFFFAWYVIISSRTCITEFLSKTGVCTLYRKLYQFLDPVIIAGAIQQSVYVVVKRINENRWGVLGCCFIIASIFMCKGHFALIYEWWF